MRAMDQLCQRIMASMEYASRDHTEEHTGIWSSSASRVLSERGSILHSPGLRDFTATPLPLHTESSLPSLPAVTGHGGRVISHPTHRTLPRRALSIQRSIETASSKQETSISPPSQASSLLSKASGTLSECHSDRNSTSRPRSSISEPSRVVLTAPTSPEVSHSNSDRVSSPDPHPPGHLPLAHDDVDTHRTSIFSIQSSVFALGGESVPEASPYTGTASVTTLQPVRDTSIGEGPRLRRMNVGVWPPHDMPDHRTDNFHGADNHVPVTSPGMVHMAGDLDSQTQRDQPMVSPTWETNSVAEQPSHNMASPWEDHTMSHFTIDSGPYFSENAPVVERETESKVETASNEQYRRRALHSGMEPPEQSQATDVQNLDRMSSQPPDAGSAGTRSLSQDHLMASDGVRANKPARAAPSHTMGPKDVILCMNSPGTNEPKEPHNDNVAPPPRTDPPGKAIEAYSLQSPTSITSGWDVQFNEKLRPMPDLANEKFSASLTQADYQERLSTLPKGIDNIWFPLARPALHNRYHGFCKGAWQIRKTVRYKRPRASLMSSADKQEKKSRPADLLCCV
jgi:hypothetical protein